MSIFGEQIVPDGLTQPGEPPPVEWVTFAFKVNKPIPATIGLLVSPFRPAPGGMGLGYDPTVQFLDPLPPGLNSALSTVVGTTQPPVNPETLVAGTAWPPGSSLSAPGANAVPSGYYQQLAGVETWIQGTPTAQGTWPPVRCVVTDTGSPQGAAPASMSYFLLSINVTL